MADPTIALRTATGVYVLVTDGVNWGTALQAAQGASGTNSAGAVMAGQLLAVSQAEEQSAVSDWLLKLYSAGGDWGTAADGGGIPYVWLGASDLAVEGRWQWANGEAFTYANWGTGKLWNGRGQTSEPDDYQGQDALAIGLKAWPGGYSDGNGLGSAGQWNDIDENNFLPYVIEFSADAVRVDVGVSHYAFDLEGRAGQVAKTLGAVFGLDAAGNATYAGIGLSLLDGGMSYEALMQLALEARLGVGASNSDVVNVLYTNVVGAPPSQAELNFYLGLLESKAHTHASLGILAADTHLNISNIGLVGLAQTGLAFELA